MALTKADEDAIRALTENLCRAVDEGDFDAWAASYTEDGTVISAAGTLSGREAIVAEGRHLRATLPAVSTCRHLVFDLTVHGDGRTARGRSEFRWIDPLDGGAAICAGTYHDVFRRVETWQIAERRVELSTSAEDFAANLARANDVAVRAAETRGISSRRGRGES